MVITREQWFRLSMKTRRRWWKETEYGTKDASSDLMKFVLEELMGERNDERKKEDERQRLEDESDPDRGV